MHETKAELSAELKGTLKIPQILSKNSIIESEGTEASTATATCTVHSPQLPHAPQFAAILISSISVNDKFVAALNEECEELIAGADNDDDDCSSSATFSIPHRRCMKCDEADEEDGDVEGN